MLRVEVERISGGRHFQGVPDLVEERVGSNADRITISYLNSDFIVISDRIDLV